ncbi:Gfo/Idh/MocA family oxidoreductase [Microbacterium elymi]|uniref:Gfo/Idh/MocA family oxidoreductase n=1 Tax=Microbacterium elymi TaxID=2909587 RepID=A0ABY5NH75_9MICO|nr:Gfo/Idh/MocA family oxidoreductase [Microbacterium elymi]UUT34549.1 Gfo/Idh/MocA family oxidoreductase [Microbacterium elymi]
MEVRMRLGVIGTGRIGSQHAAVLAARSDVDEVIVCDVDGDRARGVAQQVGGSAAEGTAALFAAQPDGVLIAAPTSQHAALIREAVRAQVPVFCEKPVAQSLADTVATVAEVESSGIPVQIGFQRRFDEGYRRVRDAVHGGQVGELASDAPAHLRSRATARRVRAAQRGHLPRLPHPRLRHPPIRQRP